MGERQLRTILIAVAGADIRANGGLIDKRKLSSKLFSLARHNELGLSLSTQQATQIASDAVEAVLQNFNKNRYRKPPKNSPLERNSLTIAVVQKSKELRDDGKKYSIRDLATHFGISKSKVHTMITQASAPVLAASGNKIVLLECLLARALPTSGQLLVLGETLKRRLNLETDREDAALQSFINEIEHSKTSIRIARVEHSDSEYLGAMYVVSRGKKLNQIASQEWADKVNLSRQQQRGRFRLSQLRYFPQHFDASISSQSIVRFICSVFVVGSDREDIYCWMEFFMGVAMSRNYRGLRYNVSELKNRVAGAFRLDSYRGIEALGFMHRRFTSPETSKFFGAAVGLAQQIKEMLENGALPYSILSLFNEQTRFSETLSLHDSAVFKKTSEWLRSQEYSESVIITLMRRDAWSVINRNQDEEEDTVDFSATLDQAFAPPGPADYLYGDIGVDSDELAIDFDAEDEIQNEENLEDTEFVDDHGYIYAPPDEYRELE